MEETRSSFWFSDHAPREIAPGRCLPPGSAIEFGKMQEGGSLTGIVHDYRPNYELAGHITAYGAAGAARINRASPTVALRCPLWRELKEILLPLGSQSQDQAYVSVLSE